MLQLPTATTIRARLTRHMLVAGLAPLVVLGAVAYLTLSSAVHLFDRGLETSAHTMETRVVASTLSRTAEDLSARIDSYIEERVKDVLIWASEPLVVEAAVRASAQAAASGWPGYPDIVHDPRLIGRIEDDMKATRSLNPVPAATQYLKDQLALSKVFKEVFFTDKSGYNAAVSNMTSDFVQSDEAWWVNAWTKGIDIGGSSQNPLTAKRAAVSGVRVAFDDSAGVWSVSIAVRIDRPRTREPLGVMKAVLDVSAVQALASNAARRISGGDVKVIVAATGDLIADTSVQHARHLVMSPEGNLLSHRFRPAELVARTDGPRAGYLLGPGEWHGTAPAVEQVIGYARSGGRGEFKDLPEFEGLGWAAIVGQERHVALGALDELKHVGGALADRRRWLPVAVLGVAGAAAVGIVGFGMVLGRRMATPLDDLVAAARRVSEGDLNVQVPVRSQDEMGRLTATFNDTVVRLRSQVQTEAERDEERRKRTELQANIARFMDAVVEISHGDLTRHGEVTADVLGGVVDAVNLMVEEIATILASVRAAAVRVAGGSREISTAADDTARSAQAQTRDAMGATAATDGLARSVRQVAANAEQSARAAQETLEAAQKGEAAVQASLDRIQRVRREVQAISRRIKGLGDRSLEISMIASTIEEIAAQTNLLALNATIEAAGAGEAGIRFGVVADEVRKLAERVARATKDIAAVVKTVQAEMQEAVLVTERGTTEVETGYAATREAGASLKEIGGLARRSAGLAQEISLATGQQAPATESVALSVQAISGLAVEIEQDVLQTRKTVEELVKVADELMSTLARFTLPA